MFSGSWKGKVSERPIPPHVKCRNAQHLFLKNGWFSWALLYFFFFTSLTQDIEYLASQISLLSLCTVWSSAQFIYNTPPQNTHHAHNQFRSTASYKPGVHVASTPELKRLTKCLHLLENNVCTYFICFLILSGKIPREKKSTAKKKFPGTIALHCKVTDQQGC